MIARDGSNISLWQEADPYKVTNSASKNVYDVAIIGAGITGLTVGLMLQKAGKNCAIFEAQTVCFGTTAATTAHINNFADTTYQDISKNFGQENALLVAQAIGNAINLIKENISNYKIACDFEETDAFLFSQSEKENSDLEAIMKGMQSVGLKPEYVTSLPIPFSFERVLKIGGQAKFNPLRYCFALAKAFEEAGGIIYENCRVTGTDENSEIAMTTEKGEFRSAHLIYATHIPPGQNLLNLRCAPYRTYAIALSLADNAYPDSLVYDVQDPYHYYRTYETAGKKYLIAGGEDHKTGHLENQQSCFTKLESYISAHFKVQEIIYKWSSQYFEPVDGLPYIGHMPGNPGNILLATGYGGNGMMYSQIASSILTDIVLQKENQLSKIFDPNRIKPIAGMANFIKENADVLKQYVTKWFSSEKLNEVTGIATGEGKTVEFEGKEIALYKNENGALVAVSSICTHLGCRVAWNNAEKSWDCPCHGSRFSPEGEVLTGPATKPLEKISLSMNNEMVQIS